MAKKSKRPIRRDVNTIVENTASDSLTTNRPTGFNPDYQVVIRDIRRVGILAGSFIAVLIILVFFLH
jgi:hypothetical protein